MKNALVTGGTGVSGVALIRYLLNKGIEITALIRPNSTRRIYLPNHPKLHITECEMSEYRNITETLKKEKRYNAFFHLAWDGSTAYDKSEIRDNMQMQNQNVRYMIDAVELCHALDCPVFIATGSQAEYGSKEQKITETTSTTPENGYGYAKLCAGGMTRILCSKYGIKHIWARLFSVYGPYDGTNSLIYTSILKILQGEPQKYTKGEQIWDYLFSLDAAKALYLLAEKGKAGETYCVANGKAQALADYIKVIHKVITPNSTPVLGEIPYTKKQVMSLQADISKLVQDTGFMPEYTFEQGIIEVVQWSKNELLKNKE